VKSFETGEREVSKDSPLWGPPGLVRGWVLGYLLLPVAVKEILKYYIPRQPVKGLARYLFYYYK
jgi:hypothetical protein